MGRRGGEQLLIGNMQLASLLDSYPFYCLFSSRASRRSSASLATDLSLQICTSIFISMCVTYMCVRVHTSLSLSSSGLPSFFELEGIKKVFTERGYQPLSICVCVCVFAYQLTLVLFPFFYSSRASRRFSASLATCRMSAQPNLSPDTRSAPPASTRPSTRYS